MMIDFSCCSSSVFDTTYMLKNHAILCFSCNNRFYTIVNLRENRVFPRFPGNLNGHTFDISNPKEITDPIRKNHLSNPKVKTVKILFLKNR